MLTRHVVVCFCLLGFTSANAADLAMPQRLIGYTELQTNLPGGRHANVRTMRAAIVQADGVGRRLLAEQLADEPDAWTQFAGWSADGRTAVVIRGWQSPENARWEEEHQTFRFTPEGWLVDSFLVDLATGQTTNVTAVNRVSFYNAGVVFWPKDPTQLGFTALIDGNSHPFRMDLDGRNKVDLTKASNEFTYGFSSSPDGRRIAYHKSYQVYLADADGSHVQHVATGKAFNFAPTWSPDGQWVLFVSGEHYDCHPHVVRADGTELRKLADRGGYRGVTEFLDVADFHHGSSDIPAWSADGRLVFYTAQVGSNVELFQATLDGVSTQLTDTAPGTLHYHPQPSPDGQWLLYGSKRDGVRQLFIRRLVDGAERRLTDLRIGRAAMWAHWQPRAESSAEVAFVRRDGALGIRLGDVEVASYVYRDEQVPRPYFAHVRTPSGLPVTRSHPPRQGQDAVDHAGLHTGIWLSFGDLSGCDYWRLKAPTEHLRFIEEPQGGQGFGSFAVLNRYLTADRSGTVCEETCRYHIRTLPHGYLIDMASEFRAGEEDVVFGDQEEMGLGIRVATPLAVDRQRGGRILDDAGRRNGAEVWGQTAAWCDYAGPFGGKWVGLTVMTDPANFRPSWSHARDYGFLAMNPFGRHAFTKQEPSRVVVQQGAPLRLRYGVIVHESAVEADYLAADAYRMFVQSTGE